MSDQYERFLKRAAQKWGSSNPDEARRPHEVAEIYRYDDCSIKVFTYNNQYGYCLDLHLKKMWALYGPFLGFSDPYPTLRLALEAAIDNVIREANDRGGSEKKGVIKWARSLILHKQLALFPNE